MSRDHGAGREHAGCRPLRFDPSLARGLSYYTGAIMEIDVPDLAGSLGGGGRYDNLVGMFLGQQVPACGFSLGLERILVVMAERGMFPAEVEGVHADVMVAQWSAETTSETLSLAREFAQLGCGWTSIPTPTSSGNSSNTPANATCPSSWSWAMRNGPRALSR